MGYNPFTNHLLYNFLGHPSRCLCRLPAICLICAFQNYVIGGVVSHAFIHPLYVMYEKIRYKYRYIYIHIIWLFGYNILWYFHTPTNKVFITSVHFNFYLNNTTAAILQNARRGVYFRTPGAYGPLGGQLQVFEVRFNPSKSSWLCKGCKVGPVNSFK